MTSPHMAEHQRHSRVFKISHDLQTFQAEFVSRHQNDHESGPEQALPGVEYASCYNLSSLTSMFCFHTSHVRWWEIFTKKESSNFYCFNVFSASKFVCNKEWNSIIFCFAYHRANRQQLPLPPPWQEWLMVLLGKTAYKLGGKRKLSLKKATSSCVAGMLFTTGMLFTIHSSLAPLYRPQSHGQHLSIYDRGPPWRKRTCRAKWGTHLFSNRLTHPGKGFKLGALGKDYHDLWRSDHAEGSEGAAEGQHNREGFCTPQESRTAGGSFQMLVYQCKDQASWVLLARV